MVAAMKTFMFILVLIAMFVTLGVLATGIIGMARGGEFNKRNSNRIMRLRVIMQGVAVLLFLLFVLLAKG